jgi:hypothetical protein
MDRALIQLIDRRATDTIMKIETAARKINGGVIV